MFAALALFVSAGATQAHAFWGGGWGWHHGWGWGNGDWGNGGW